MAMVECFISYKENRFDPRFPLVKRYSRGGYVYIVAHDNISA